MKNFLLLTLLFLVGCQSTEYKTTFSTTPEKPESNQKITIKYLPEKTELAQSKNIDALIYQYDADLLSTKQIKMKKDGKGWIAEFTPEKNAKGALIVFTDGEKTDNNDGKGYALNFYDQNGNPLPEAIAGRIVALSQWGTWFLDLDSDNNTTRKKFEEFFSKYPDLKGKYLDFYLYTLSRIGTEEAMMNISEEIDALKNKKEPEENDLVIISKYSERLGIDAEKYENILLEKYPQNDYSAEIAFNRIENKAETPEGMFKDFMRFKEKYPTAKNMEFASYKVIKEFIDTGETEAAIKHLDELKDIIHPYIFIYSTNKLLNKNDFKHVLAIAEIGEKALTQSKSEAPNYLSKQEWEKEKNNYFAEILKTEAIVQNKFGNKKDALEKIQKAAKITGTDDVEINELYSDLLVNAGKYKEAKEVIEKCMQKNKNSEKMVELLKIAYTKVNGSEEGFDEYLGKYTAAAEALLLKELKGEMINIPAPDFELKNLEGKKVKLSDFKGKTVVVDFWATWCGPCKHSFPAMQKANDKFADDENVQFLFINAWERVDDKFKNAKDFITANNYKLNVLVDEKNEVISKFRVTGIPTKFVIGPDQKIKFKSVGFAGTNDELVKEVSAMIKLASGK